MGALGIKSKPTKSPQGPLVFKGERMLATFKPGRMALRFPGQEVAAIRL
jgi:hypothetical protein